MNQRFIRKTGLYLLLCILIFFVLNVLLFSDEVSECVECHTSARTLIGITRVIAEEFGELLLASPESEGEG